MVEISASSNTVFPGVRARPSDRRPSRGVFQKDHEFFKDELETDVLRQVLQGGGMNKSQLTEALARQEGLPFKKAEEVVKTVFGEMEAALIRGKRVEIRGLGSFKVKEYDGYKGRNPKTGEIIEVARKRLPFFKVGKELKERVDYF